MAKEIRSACGASGRMNRRLRAMAGIMRGAWRRYLLAAIMLAASGHAAPDQPNQAAPPYQHFLVGDPADVKRPRPAFPALVLMGGGRSVPEAFQWMINRSGGGNFVVI